jgi:hypothetical protein
MRKALAFFLLLALCCFAGQGVLLYAQEDEPDYEQTITDDDGGYNETNETVQGDEPAYDETIPDDNDNSQTEADTEPDVDIYIPDMYTSGDQTVNISLGAVIPTVFLNRGSVIDHNINPPIGYILSAAYIRFLGSNFFLGGEIGFASAYTLGENALYIIPIGARVGWQFVFRRFEFPLYAAIGMAPQRYLDREYFGMYLKGAASAYYRIHPNWSFGISADWSWFPQWPMEDGKRIPDKDIDANLFNVMLSARYHF